MKKPTAPKKPEHAIALVAIRGIQAGREYYTTMVPFRLVARLFEFSPDDLPANMRHQRTLNTTRVPKIAEYILGNPRDYTLPSIVVSIDPVKGDIIFEPVSEEFSNMGRLYVPVGARWLINDGQHRQAAIRQAIEKARDLGEEHLTVTVFWDAGLRRSQQMFADLNRNGSKPTATLNVLFDHRDALSDLARKVAEQSPFKGLVELEKGAVGTRSSKLFTLSNIYEATRSLLNKAKGAKLAKGEAEFVAEFWQALPWLNDLGKQNAFELRRDSIVTSGVALQAVAIASRALVTVDKDWKAKLANLDLDWSKSNPDWQGRCIVSGRLTKTSAAVSLTAAVIKRKLGVSLSPHEAELERGFNR